MDERFALFTFDAMGQRERVVVDFAFEQDLRPICPTHADNRLRHAARHDHGRLRTQRRRRERHALGVTPGRGRDYPAPPCRLVERGDLVESAPHLEGAGRLESLDLEIDVGPKVGRQERRSLERGAG